MAENDPELPDFIVRFVGDLDYRYFSCARSKPELISSEAEENVNIHTIHAVSLTAEDSKITVPLVEGDLFSSKPESISSEDFNTFMKTCNEEIKFSWERHMEVAARYKHFINEPSLEFSSHFKIEEFCERNLGSRRVQLKPEEAATFERTKSSGEAFQYEKLTDTILRSKERVFAILGSLGAGTTILLRRIIRDLCELKGIQKLVMFKFFRDFSDEKEITLSHLLFGGLFEDDSMETKGYKWLLENQEKAIFILDGLDESSSLINSKAKRINQHGKGKASEIISNIFRGDLLPEVKIVYTSRDHAVASLEGECRPDMVIVMTGLSQTDVKSLFISLVGDKGKDLWHKLVSQAHLLVPFLSTPLFVIFAAIVYKTSTGEPPQFVTGLMLEILELFKGSDHIMDKNIEKIMRGLERMSFDGLQRNMVLFTVKHVEAAGLKLEEIIDLMIKVPGRNKLNQYLLEGTEVLFYSHQSIQEILGGCHVSKLSLPEFTTVVHEYLSNDYWSLTLRFVSGILFNKETEEFRANIENVQEKQEVLKGMLASKYKNANSETENLSVLAAISESNDKEFIQSVIDSIRISDYPISAAGMHVIGSILRHCQLLENLKLRNCSLDDTTANILWQCVSGKDCNVQISKLDVSGNPLNEKTAAVLGDIVKRCLVKELMMQKCGLNDGSLKTLLSRSSGAKLLYLNVKGNSITRPAIEQIRKTIWVEKIVDDFDIDKVHGLPPRIVGGKLMLDVDQPTTQAYEFLSDEAEAEKLDESIRESLSAPVIKGELIGPEGGSINVLDCKADYPPDAFQKKTPVRHSVRSSYHNAPEGFVVCSPELESTAFGIPFKGSVTITLPLHIIPEDGQVVILKRKGYDSPWIEFLTRPVNEKDRMVTFEVSRCRSWIACIKSYFLEHFGGRVHLSHYLFYRPDPWQLITLTCIDQSSVKTKCVANYIREGWTEAQPLPDKIVLHNDECITYKYICIEPDTSRVSPDVEISIKKRDVVDYLTPTFLRLQPKPPPDQDCVICRVIRPPHGPEKKSEIVLENKNQRSREHAGGIDRSFLHEPAGAGRTEENAAAGGIVPGSGESAQGIFFEGAATWVTVAKQIWQGSGASNPAVMYEAAGAGTSMDLSAGTSVDFPNIAPGAGEAEGSLATGGNMPGGAGSLEGLSTTLKVT